MFSFLKNLFGKNSNNQEYINPSNLHEFIQLSIENKMRFLISLETQAQPQHYPILEHAILNETNINLKFAALKRARRFKDNPNLVPMLKEMRDKGSGAALEPYFSMALVNLNIITVEEFRELMNK